MRRYIQILAKSREENRNAAINIVARAGGNLGKAVMTWKEDCERGSINASNAVEILILIFVAIIVIYQLIPFISNSNTTVQGSANVSSMGKFAAGLGEWLFPLLGIVAICFLLFRQSSRSKGKSKG